MASRAALIMAAVSGLLGGAMNARNDQRTRDVQERKLAIEEAELANKFPSHGVANLEFLRRMYPDREVSRDEALRLLSPAGFGASPMPGELAAYMNNPSGVQGYLDAKARAGKATYDFGGDEGGADSAGRDDPATPRPAVRAPGASQPAPPAVEAPPEASVPAASPATSPAKPSGSVRKRFNPATGQLEAVEKINFNDLSTED